MSLSPVVTSIKQLESLIFDHQDDSRPMVIMTCGLAGSGKSTLSHTLVKNHPTLTRLSIDSYVHAHHGLYKIDYPAEKYESYQIEAESSLREQLKTTLLLSAQSDDNPPPYVLLDFSFAFKETRDEWKHLIEQGGGKWILVYMDVEFDEIRRRVRERNHQREIGARKDADSAFDLTEEVLEMYIQGFERPIGEGEVILRL
ncbi:hypothetical protein PISL3812_09119 [Talaromyces islandicus]|uniref:ATP/GTP-binding protein n=1 Tax=Talaromyces islandicus TaxID=28573 RepID=A0A0U1M8T1_TALIS|nr:hypothetical protein PISL3812_09119 [Talaromyces islandicus]